MIEGLPDIPPAVVLLVRELVSSKDWISARKRIKAALPDLRQQSEAYDRESFARSIQRPLATEFDIHLHGGLDLFDEHAPGCRAISCRIKQAERIARSLGLIADRIWFTDFLTEKFLDFGRATNAKLDAVVEDAYVLVTLWPLIAAGIVRFRTPWIATCQNCLSHFNNEIETIAKGLAPTFSDRLSISPWEGGYVINTKNCFEPPLVFRSIKGKQLPSIETLAAEMVTEQVSSALWVGREAALRGGAVFSNSRIALSGLLQQEGRFRSNDELAFLDSERAIDVPWVSELDPAQIVQLREEASNALPQFREMLAQTMAARADADASTTQISDVIKKLRQQAAEVRSELGVTQKHSARLFKKTYLLLGFGLTAYGVARDQAVAGAVGLLPLLQLLIGHVSGHEKDVAKLNTKPGYVLVKAQDILSHAH